MEQSTPTTDRFITTPSLLSFFAPPMARHEARGPTQPHGGDWTLNKMGRLGDFVQRTSLDGTQSQGQGQRGLSSNSTATMWKQVNCFLQNVKVEFGRAAAGMGPASTKTKGKLRLGQRAVE